MFPSLNGDSNAETSKEGCVMESTHDFIANVQEKQQKDEQNRKNQGKGNPSSKLPNKKHQQSN